MVLQFLILLSLNVINVYIIKILRKKEKKKNNKILVPQTIHRGFMSLQDDFHGRKKIVIALKINVPEQMWISVALDYARTGKNPIRVHLFPT